MMENINWFVLVKSDSHCIFVTEDFIYAIRGRIESCESEVSSIEYKDDIYIIHIIKNCNDRKF